MEVGAGGAGDVVETLAGYVPIDAIGEGGFAAEVAVELHQVS